MRSFLVLILLLILMSSSFPQVHYIENYPGIPVVAHLNRDSRKLTTQNLNKMTELGVLGFYASELTQAMYDEITGKGLKVFPYQVWIDSALVVFYTDAVYTRWEAEGNIDKSKGDVELKHTSLGSVEGEFLVTNQAEPGTLIRGPAYAQDKKYKQLPSDEIIEYTAEFRMKISQIVQELPAGYMNDVVCTLRIVATDPYFNPLAEEDVVPPIEVTVGDFLGLSGGVWDSCIVVSFNNYTLESLQDLTLKELDELKSGDPEAPVYTNKWMQYKVVWNGLPYLRLHVDYIEVYDDKGLRLKQNINDTRLSIENYIRKYPEFTNEQNVLGWFGLNEPQTIDNFEPFRIVDEIIRSVNNKLRLYTTFTTGYNGLYGGYQPGNLQDLNGYVYKGTEFIKRTGLSYLSLNTYMYHYPYTHEENYWLENIKVVTENNLSKLKYDNGERIPLSHSVQSGRFHCTPGKKLSEPGFSGFGKDGHLLSFVVIDGHLLFNAKRIK